VKVQLGYKEDYIMNNINKHVNYNALYKNALYYSQSADIILSEVISRSNNSDFESFEKTDIGLIIPATTLMSFSCELFLKLILVINLDITKVKGHNLESLYKQIPDKFKNDILQMMLDNNEDFNAEEFEICLHEIALLFIESRYVHEQCSIMISYEFLREFRNVLMIISARLIDKQNRNQENI